MLDILWTGNKKKEVPIEYIELVFCRDIYHCTPNEFWEVPMEVVEMHMEIMGIEEKVRSFGKPKGK